MVQLDLVTFSYISNWLFQMYFFIYLIFGLIFIFYLMNDIKVFNKISIEKVFQFLKSNEIYKQIESFNNLYYSKKI